MITAKHKQPVIYEINTAVFIHELSVRFSVDITLATVPDEVWDEIASYGIDTVWFMGVWKRSAISADMAKGQLWVRDALPDATYDDVIGSAYSIADYSVDERFGGDEGLTIARRNLSDRGIRLMLDYVPNHVAIDHRWVYERPEYFIQGTEEEYANQPDNFVQIEQTFFANGRDPNFPAWSDVLQLNAFSDGLRYATVQTLLKIASMCDGVRCDMAMLMMNGIFQKTWEKRAGKRPHTEFWPGIIESVKDQYPEFLFLAEVYWNKEAELLRQGFDLCYDKRLYDYLIDGSSSDIRRHLQKTESSKYNLMRFIENHDEERAAETMSLERHRAAAVIMATLPGAHLYHEGEFEGYHRRVPVQLNRRYKEPLDQSIQEFYLALTTTIRDQSAAKGQWSLLPVHRSFLQHVDVLAWSWVSDKGGFITIVNFGDKPYRGFISLPTQLHARSFEQVFGTVDCKVKGKKASIHASSWSYAIIKNNYHGG